jgi:phage-related protein
MKHLLSLFPGNQEKAILFDVIFLEEAFDFLRRLDKKHSEKILYNIRKAQNENDPELFKKINNEIWEFRTTFQTMHYRFLAFWDKTEDRTTLVIITHGFVKKRRKIPMKEIQKAIRRRNTYFKEKEMSK